jgi:hypothetical protein
MHRLSLVVALLTITHLSLAQHTSGWTKGNPVRDDLYMWNPYGYINRLNALDKTSKKLSYSIVFKDSTQILTPAKIGEHKGNFFLYVDNETMTRSIRPNETLSITYIPKKGSPLVGVPTDSCWVFKLIEGPVNLYSVTPQPLDQFVIYIQKGNDGPMMKATKGNIRKQLKNDQSVQVDINTNQFRSAVTKHNLFIERENKKTLEEK